MMNKFDFVDIILKVNIMNRRINSTGIDHLSKTSLKIKDSIFFSKKLINKFYNFRIYKQKKYKLKIR